MLIVNYYCPHLLQQKSSQHTFFFVGFSCLINSKLSFQSLSFPPDGELYTGTVSNFQGNEPVIYKSLGQGAALKTENSLKWLQGKLHSPHQTGRHFPATHFPLCTQQNR